MPSVLVTGASRGLGLALTRGLARRGWTVWAAARQPGAGLPAELAGDVRPVALDLTDAASIDSLPDRIATPSLDLLFNCAGLLGAREPPEGPRDTDGWAEIFQVNVTGTMRLTLALLPLLRKGGRKVVSLTSRLGSIAESNGGTTGYRASKAALNAAMRSLSQEPGAKDFVIAIVTPGWVRTDMGGAGAPVAAEDRAEALIELLPRLGPAQSGCFLNFDGTGITW
jgi:NAD(P)-dependent dehydrogenase (short-subunit alcohol dehydrogenase family)